MDVARNLAEFTADITGDPAGLPSAVTGQCRDMMLNAAAAALAGAAHPDGVALTRFVREMGGNGRCTIIGMGMRTSPVYAALVNGSLVRMLDYDDHATDTGYNATAAVFPTVMALGEMYGIPGSKVLSAFVAGCEIAVRLSATSNSAGAIAAAAAAAALLEMDADGVANAISIAAGIADGQVTYSTAGTTALATGGRAAMNGTMAALMANAGIGESASESALVQASTSPVFDQHAVAGLGERWRLTEPGVSLRLYPCNPASHSVIDATIGVAQLHRVQPDQVKNLHVGVTADTLSQLPYVLPTDAWQARSCLGFIAAATLCHGQPLINFFSEPAIQDEGVRAMMEKVSVEASLPSSPLSVHPAEVRVTLNDGTTFHHRVDHARGTPAMPLDADELEAKFLYCTRYILPADHIDEAVSSFRNIETIANITGMASVLGG
ncbi:Cis-aconitate decarboxylase [Geodia barretti]|uniref:Cis-aconitate decarboxylase n=1 Tax=Geodia barretti TaxID=519541 RepID=A0AA35QZW5_GEOBA|nr:Cis-aconitate decarboxylase [Geodia barretti]